MMIYIKSFCALLAAMGFGVLFNIRGKKLFGAAFVGGVAWFFYEIFVNYGEFVQYFAAGASIAVLAEVMARIQRSPATLYIAPALIPLVPGGSLYRAMLHALSKEHDLFLTVGINAFVIIGALTLGLISLSSVARLFAAKEPHIPRAHSTDESELHRSQF